VEGREKQREREKTDENELSKNGNELLRAAESARIRG
jgi:hypothetical protein